MPIAYTRRTDGVGQFIYSNYINELQQGIETISHGVYNVMEAVDSSQSASYARADGTTDDSTACTTADTNNAGHGVTYAPPTTASYRISQSITLAHALDLPPGALLNIDSGKVVALNGLLHAGPYQIFGGAGTVALSAKACARGVRAEWFGVVGDGVTDNRVALRALMAALPASGAVVWFGAGTYLTSLAAHPVLGDPYYCGFAVPTNTALIGAGRGATVIKLAASQGIAGNNNAVINNMQMAAGGDTFISFNDLTVDGNNTATQGATCRGIDLLRVRGAAHNRVVVKNCYGTGKSSLTEAFHFEAGLSTDVTYTDCTAEGTAGSTASGFSADSSTGVHYQDCIAYGMSVAHGFTHNTCADVTYTGCHSYLNALFGFNSEGTNDPTYSGCIAGGDSANAAGYPYAALTSLGNASNGFVLNGSKRAQLIGCIARRNVSGLFIENTSTVRVIGGAYRDNTAFGISVDASSVPGVRVSGGPDIGGNTTAQVSVPNGYFTPNGGVAVALAASGVALPNPFCFDTTMYISGGTVTQVAVQGGVTGLTSGAFRWPAGNTLTVTYSVLPLTQCNCD